MLINSVTYKQNSVITRGNGSAPTSSVPKTPSAQPPQKRSSAMETAGSIGIFMVGLILLDGLFDGISRIKRG